ncbi:MAG TPA: hypothetical protein VGE76_03065 [Opitutaceae bacterium]
MSAKPAKKKSQPAPTPAAPAAAVPAPAMPAPAPASTAPTSWLDSADPRQRRYGQIALVVVWLYVAALWLLALDQLFGRGIFGSKAAVS